MEENFGAEKSLAAVNRRKKNSKRSVAKFDQHKMMEQHDADHQNDFEKLQLENQLLRS